jgi:hypothetical protein
MNDAEESEDKPMVGEVRTQRLAGRAGRLHTQDGNFVQTSIAGRRCAMT